MKKYIITSIKKFKGKYFTTPESAVIAAKQFNPQLKTITLSEVEIPDLQCPDKLGDAVIKAITKYLTADMDDYDTENVLCGLNEDNLKELTEQIGYVIGKWANDNGISVAGHKVLCTEEIEV